VFSNLLPGNDSFAANGCNGKVFSGPLLSNGRLAENLTSSMLWTDGNRERPQGGLPLGLETSN
jgi:hypothetical protein